MARRKKEIDPDLDLDIADPGDTINVTEERAKLYAVQREKIELEVAFKRGDLIRSAEVEKALANMLCAFRSKVLAIPNRVAQELAEELDPRLVAARLHEVLTECLSELARYDGKHENGVLQ